MLEQRIHCRCPTATVTSFLLLTVWRHSFLSVATQCSKRPTLSHLSEVSLLAAMSLSIYLSTGHWSSEPVGQVKHEIHKQHALTTLAEGHNKDAHLICFSPNCAISFHNFYPPTPTPTTHSFESSTAFFQIHEKAGKLASLSPNSEEGFSEF